MTPSRVVEAMGRLFMLQLLVNNETVRAFGENTEESPGTKASTDECVLQSTPAAWHSHSPESGLSFKVT